VGEAAHNQYSLIAFCDATKMQLIFGFFIFVKITGRRA
jgi:hypothetical protein